MSEAETVSRSLRPPIVLTCIFAIVWLYLWLDWITDVSVLWYIQFQLFELFVWISELVGPDKFTWFDEWLLKWFVNVKSENLFVDYEKNIHPVGFYLSLLPVAWWFNRANPGGIARIFNGLQASLQTTRTLFGDGRAYGFVRVNTDHRGPSMKPLHRYAVNVACIFPIWHLLIFTFNELGWMSLSAMTFRVGLCITFVTGLGLTVFWVERKSRALQVARLESSGALAKVGPLQSMHESVAAVAKDCRIWNPFDMDAWFYGRKKQKLRQSLSVLFGYLFVFILIVLLLLQASGCQELYEMPAGGGEQKQLQQVVKVQKVIKKKFIINPLSSVIFNPPPLEEIKLQLLEITKHAYQVGYGKGAGAGFSGGTNRGKVRFIRLEYSGGDWDQGIDADLNMLIQYNLRTQHKIAERPETRKVAQLKNFPVGKSPPVVYMTGQKNISLGKSETDVLRGFLIEKHGMLFADNGGSAHWGNQFKALMGRVLPNVPYIRVPLDHPIHRVPYPIPFLPYVAPHGGTDALAWVVDGRIAAYYHPGDIGDAWADDHAGVPTPIWEACYQLGTNVIFYAHAEYNKWLDSRKKSD